MEILKIISGPIIGAIIGYFTNYLAIKMLFKPLNPIKIGRFTLPFTPGIIPKRKNQLGKILGDAVMEKFFTYDDLENVFMSDFFRDAVTSSITDYFYKEDNSKIEISTLTGSVSSMENLKTKIQEELCIRILASFLRADIGSLITSHGPEIIKKTFRNSKIAKIISDEILESVSGTLGKEIENFILKDGKNLVMPMIETEMAELASQKPKDLLSQLEIDPQTLKNILDNIYNSFMKNHTAGIVSHIDVSGIIEQKLLEMDAKEIEDLSLSVVKRELTYIVLLGAFLGAVIGTVNIFI